MTISEIEDLLAFLLLVFLCRIAVATRALSPHEPVILVSRSKATSLFLCISVDPDIALAPTRASALSFSALVSSRTIDSPVRNACNTHVIDGLELLSFDPMVKRGWSIDKDLEPHATGMKALASQYKMNMIFTESILVLSSGSWSLCRAHLDTTVYELCLQVVGLSFPRPTLVRYKIQY